LKTASSGRHGKTRNYGSGQMLGRERQEDSPSPVLSRGLASSPPLSASLRENSSGCGGKPYQTIDVSRPSYVLQESTSRREFSRTRTARPGGSRTIPPGFVRASVPRRPAKRDPSPGRVPKPQTAKRSRGAKDFSRRFTGLPTGHRGARRAGPATGPTRG
jgi:hypothetical protein